MSLVFIGLAAIQLEKDCLQEEVRSHAIILIEQGSDEEDYEERKKVLIALKRQLINC